MKKQFVLAGLLAAGFASAQTDKGYLGKVGINIMTPQATIDIRPNDDNRQETATTNEGILIPKLSKTRVANIEDALLVEGTLVYVTDEAASTIASYTGTNAKVAKITEKGYYYYNGTEWVKSGVGANDQLWAQRDNSGVTETYLKPANANGDYVGYRSDRKWGLNLGNAQESDFDWGNGAKGFVASEVPSSIAITSDVFPTKGTIGTNGNYYYFSNDNYLLKNAHVSANPSAVYLGKEHRTLIKDVTSRLGGGIYGLNASMDFYSNATVAGSLVGNRGVVTVGDDIGNFSNANVATSIGGDFKVRNFATSTNMTSIRGTVENRGTANNLQAAFLSTNSQLAKNGTVASHSVESLRGIGNYVTLAENGTLKSRLDGQFNVITLGANTTVDGLVRGVYTNISVEKGAVVKGTIVNTISLFSPKEGSTIGNYIDFGNYPSIGANVSIDQYVGYSFDASTNIDATSTINKMYGLKMADISRGTTLNYAIHTGTGAVRFGDLKGTGNRPVYADADGKLIIGDATSTASAFKWVEDTATNSIKLAVNSDGTTRTNAVSITDGGMVLGSSFRGTNGATIFPDYVFQKYYTGTSSIKSDYTFKTLSQVEDFVKANGHLPGYKSAEAIKAQGYVDLMETQLTNVEKIEELYLHSIEQEKVNKTQAEELKEKDAKIQELEARLEKLEKLLK